MGANDDTGSLHEALGQEIEQLQQSLSEVIEKEQDLQEQLKLLLLEKRRFQTLMEHATALLAHKEGGSHRMEASTRGNLKANQRLNAFNDGPNIVGRDIPERLGHSSGISYDRPINTGDIIANGVYSILKETEHSTGEPGVAIHYRDLVAELENRGITISGRDPGLNLVAYIHKDERFFRPKRGMYGLKEWYPHMRHNVGSRTSNRSRRSPQI